MTTKEQSKIQVLNGVLEGEVTVAEVQERLDGSIVATHQGPRVAVSRSSARLGRLEMLSTRIEYDGGYLNISKWDREQSFIKSFCVQANNQIACTRGLISPYHPCAHQGWWRVANMASARLMALGVSSWTRAA